MSEITYGPKGTQIIVVEGAKADEEGNLTEGGRTDTAYFMGYEDVTGTFFYGMYLQMKYLLLLI